jgi:hypothetical protein
MQIENTIRKYFGLAPKGLQFHDINTTKDRDDIKHALIERDIKKAEHDENIGCESYWYDILMHGFIGYEKYSDEDLLYEYYKDF